MIHACLLSYVSYLFSQDFGEFGTVVVTDTSAAAEVVVETTAAKVAIPNSVTSLSDTD